jgi:hypothetical protein
MIDGLDVTISSHRSVECPVQTLVTFLTKGDQGLYGAFELIFLDSSQQKQRAGKTLTSSKAFLTTVVKAQAELSHACA